MSGGQGYSIEVGDDHGGHAEQTRTTSSGESLVNIGGAGQGQGRISDPVRPWETLLQLGYTLFERFTLEDQLDDVRNAIRCYRLIIFLVNHANQSPIMQSLPLQMLANAYLSRFEHLGHIGDLNKAIGCRSQVLNLLPDDHMNIPSHLNILAHLCFRRFKCFGRFTDVERAIECQSRAVVLTPDDHTDRPNRLNHLGSLFELRFQKLGKVTDVTKAIEYQSRAVQLIPTSHPNKSWYLFNLGNSYRNRFQHQGLLVDVDEAIICYTQAASLIGACDDSNMRTLLDSLGVACTLRFDRLGELADIEKAIGCHSRALKLAVHDDVIQAGILTNLGCSYLSRFMRLGEFADVQKAIDCHNQALQLTPCDHPGKPGILRNLGRSYLCRFDHNGLLSDVDVAIDSYTHAMLLTPNDDPTKSSLLHGMGGAYQLRFNRLGELSDGEKAIDLQRQSLLLTPVGHPDRPRILNSMGGTYLCRFEHSDSLADVGMAIEYLSQSVLLTADDHVEKPSRLNSLGCSYQYRFERIGEVVDLDRAITYQSQSLLLAPDRDTDKPAWLSNLGNSYESRFAYLGELADSDNAIHCQTQAVLLTPEDHVDLPRWLNNLGGSYLCRFARLQDLADVDKAIEYRTQAARLVPDDHPIKSALLKNLGISYMLRFDHLKNVSDIDEAINWHNQVMLLASDTHANKPSVLGCLALSYGYRFNRLGEVADLNKAIEYLIAAVDLLPDGHPRKPAWLNELGHLYISRFERLREIIDVQSAMTILQQAVQLPVGHPLVRFQAARQWARASCILRIPPQAAYQKSVELVSELVWVGSPIQLRYNAIKEVGDISLEAASCVTLFGTYDCALEWLEAGRSIIWNQILRLRTPVDDLSVIDPLLAQRLKEIGQQLDHLGSRSSESSPTIKNLLDAEQNPQLHRRLANEWDQLLKQARQIPGFDEFLRPRKAVDLMRAAKDGPIIVIIIHGIHCDSLIIQPGDKHIARVPLENLSLKRTADARRQLMTLIGHRGCRAGGFKRSTPVSNPTELLKRILATLWLDVVKPIFDVLGYACKPPQEDLELPHVTWCTSGALSFLPLHAAGCYDGSSPNAFELVVSSYTPTLSALLVSGPPTPASKSGVLAISQEHTAGFVSLPNTVQELSEIKKLVKDTRYMQLTGPDATVDAVLNAMEEYSWVHLACHASQNATDPSQSAFHLHDGNLLLSEITKRSFRNKGLAFLSACQTATGDEALPDEAVHLAAGMLMAGYPSIIATMWGIRDDDAPEVARHVYADLLKDGKMDCTGASRALHKAVAELRRKVGEESFERWVPYIHIGS